MKRVVIPVVASLAFSVVGCASYPAPTEHLANSYANIRAAQELGAPGSPQAALHLKLAQEENAKAKALIDDDKNEQADFMTTRANADAELAIALIRESQAQTTAGHAANAVTDAHNSAAQIPTTPSSFTATTTTTSTTVPVPSTGK